MEVIQLCGIVGFTNYKKNILNPNELLENMTNKIVTRGEDDVGYYSKNEVYLGHRRLSIVDIDGGKQPMSFIEGDKKYTIVYNGEIYNYKQLRKLLLSNNVNLETRSDTEMVLKAFIAFKEKCLEHFNGMFAFCIYEETEGKLFFARDHMGVKPFFYTIYDGDIFFASEIKAIFENHKIERIIDRKGICELFGLGPARNLGSAVFKDIYELKPGHYMKFDKGNIEICNYFKIKSKEHTDDLETTIGKVRSLLQKSIENQLIADVPVGMFLSGGIDSSIITAISALTIKENNKLKTFSVDYIDNEKNFKKSDFTPSRDNDFIEIMKKKYNLNHKYIVLNSEDLYETLYEAMLARDLPAMADIDSSLLLFCKKVKQDVKVALSGEFADEIFCGYPWFFRMDSLESGTFPWSISLELRKEILNKEISKNVNISKYVEEIYKEAISNVPLEETTNIEDIQMKKNSYLTMYYFGLNLIERSDRMSMRNSLEVRVPFTDYELVEYVYNIPWEMKNHMNLEKGILRESFNDVLPKEILERKKSPYPKTYDPKYTKMVENMLAKVINNKDNKIKQLVDVDYVKTIIESDEASFSRPWFGQLMGRTALMAYLIQLEMWIVEYDVKIKI